jgi:nuclear pore complex protein Nup54
MFTCSASPRIARATRSGKKHSVTIPILLGLWAVEIPTGAAQLTSATRFVPALAVGFDDLKKRVEAQERQAKVHQAKIDVGHCLMRQTILAYNVIVGQQELSAKLNELTSKANLSTSTRLSRTSHTQVQLSARLLRLISRLHALSAGRGRPLRPNEEELKNKLEKLWVDVTGRLPAHGGAGGGKMAAMINELWVIASQRKAVRATMGGGKGEEWTVVNEEDLAKVLEVLSSLTLTLGTKTIRRF